MNKYTYEVIKCNGIPLHFVYTVTNYYEGVEVFSNKKDADDVMYINYTFGIPYDYNLSIPTGIVRQYKDNEHLFSKIENHNVYCGY